MQCSDHTYSVDLSHAKCQSKRVGLYKNNHRSISKLLSQFSRANVRPTHMGMWLKRSPPSWRVGELGSNLTSDEECTCNLVLIVYFNMGQLGHWVCRESWAHKRLFNLLPQFSRLGTQGSCFLFCMLCLLCFMCT